MSRYGTGMRSCCDSVADGGPHVVGCSNYTAPPENPCVFTVVVTRATLARLQLSADEISDGREVWQLASDAIDEYVLGLFRNRKDDPGRGL